MSYLRQHRNAWQSIIRIKGHPNLAKSFKSKPYITSKTMSKLCIRLCTGASFFSIRILHKSPRNLSNTPRTLYPI